MKRSQLKRRTPLRVRSKKRRAALIHYSQVRKDVQGRSGGRCEIGAEVCTLRGGECHHLLPRSQGGEDSVGNCVWVCHECHMWVHAHPAESYEHGWLRRRAS